jgi:hypothetical protein
MSNYAVATKQTRAERAEARAMARAIRVALAGKGTEGKR